MMCRDIGLTAGIAASLLNQFDLDENGEWSFQEFCLVLKAEDFTSYNECVPREQQPADKRMPLAPGPIVPPERNYDLLSGEDLAHRRPTGGFTEAGSATGVDHSAGAGSWASNNDDSYRADWVRMALG
jgi:hypothetical protein